MRLLPVALKQNTLKTFKGLYGQEHKEIHDDNDIFHIKEHRLVKNYHPFLDETKGEINHVLGAYQHFGGDPFGVHDYNTCIIKVCETLNFTKKEWERYNAGKLKGALSLRKRLTAELIENNLKKLNLVKYIK